jgi:hypothetical protein
MSMHPFVAVMVFLGFVHGFVLVRNAVVGSGNSEKKVTMGHHYQRDMFFGIFRD